MALPKGDKKDIADKKRAQAAKKAKKADNGGKKTGREITGGSVKKKRSV